MRLQTILDISHDGIIFIDPSRRVTTANKKAQSIFGLDKDCLGKRIIDIPFLWSLKTCCPTTMNTPTRSCSTTAPC